MPRTTEVINGDGDSIKVGTTGTIGSLMSKEIESMKQLSQASSSSRRKPQTGPVSVHCGASPKKTSQRKNPPNESGSGSSSNGTDHRTPGHGHKPGRNPRKNGHRVPMLDSDNIPVDINPNTDKMDKKGQPYIVEVVDLKCSNPMSNRLKKLGFSKLSESIA